MWTWRQTSSTQGNPIGLTGKSSLETQCMYSNDEFRKEFAHSSATDEKDAITMLLRRASAKSDDVTKILIY